MKCETCYHYETCKRFVEFNFTVENCIDYKDKSLIVELPCKVGIDVYAIINNEIKTCCCVGWKFNGGNIYMLCMDRKTGNEYSLFDFHFTGKLGQPLAFLNREEAEKVLKGRENNG